MIGTLWKSKIDLTQSKVVIGDILIATCYFQCEHVGQMYVSLMSPHGLTSTWREEWMGDKFERLP